MIETVDKAHAWDAAQRSIERGRQQAANEIDDLRRRLDKLCKALEEVEAILEEDPDDESAKFCLQILDEERAHREREANND